MLCITLIIETTIYFKRIGVIINQVKKYYFCHTIKKTEIFFYKNSLFKNY